MQIEIKDRELLIKNAAAVSVIVMLFAFFMWQLNSGISLQRQLSAKKTEFKDAKSASKRLKKLQRQLQELEEKERAISTQVPSGEKQPFGLVKALTAISGEIGLRNVVFAIGGDEKTAQSADTAMIMAYQQEDPSPVKLELGFEATYLQTLNFLKRVNGLERVVAVEGIRIERKKEILPYQKVSLKLVTYTFAAQ